MHPGLSFSGTAIDYQDIPVTNGCAFWPDLNVADFQRQRSLPPGIPAQTLANALLATLAEINAALADVVLRYQAKGYGTAQDVPGARAGNETQLTAQYKKALYARAKADLLGEFQTLGRRETLPGAEGDDTRASLLAEAALVIRSMKGLGRVGVYKV
ncbi:TPA: head completion/stabilization protein [Klebsiella michiganensis]|nr:head completion/stabilization protein [Klebsiella michiganensis]